MDQAQEVVAATCATCRSVSGVAPISPGERISESPAWVLEHAYPTSLRGWLVIVLRRHAEALHDLTPDELGELGELLRVASAGLRAETGCLKEYVLCLAEAPGFQHLHFHIVPRAHDLPEEQVAAKILIHLKPEVPLEPGVVVETCRSLRHFIDQSKAESSGAI